MANSFVLFAFLTLTNLASHLHELASFYHYSFRIHYCHMPNNAIRVSVSVCESVYVHCLLGVCRFVVIVVMEIRE